MSRFRLTRSPRLRPELPPADDPDLPAPGARTPSFAPAYRRSPLEDRRPHHGDDAHHVDDAHHGDGAHHVAELRPANQSVSVTARCGG